MQRKTLCIFAALALLLTSAPAFAAVTVQAKPEIGCSDELTAVMPLLQASICPRSFCWEDAQCLSICPDNPNSYCDLSTSTCVYPSGPGTGPGGCQSGAICSPGRFCTSHSQCASCTGGCSGYCAADGICRVL